MKNNLLDFKKNVESDVSQLMKDEFEWEIYKNTMKQKLKNRYNNRK